MHQSATRHCSRALESNESTKSRRKPKDRQPCSWPMNSGRLKIVSARHQYGYGAHHGENPKRVSEAISRMVSAGSPLSARRECIPRVRRKHDDSRGPPAAGAFPAILASRWVPGLFPKGPAEITTDQLGACLRGENGVPTVITPGEWNCLVNPLHPQVSLKWIMTGPDAYTFDARLLPVKKRKPHDRRGVPGRPRGDVGRRGWRRGIELALTIRYFTDNNALNRV